VTIVRASWIGTIAFVLVTALGVAVDDARPAVAAFDGLLFAAGIALFFWAYAVAVGRSRTDEIGIGGLFFLAGEGTAPAPTKRSLLGALAVQTVVGVAAAFVDPEPLAAGVLVPLYGLALTGLYGARHGRFGPRRAR
jgi:hypothetical protein